MLYPYRQTNQHVLVMVGGMFQKVVIYIIKNFVQPTCLSNSLIRMFSQI